MKSDMNNGWVLDFLLPRGKYHLETPWEILPGTLTPLGN